MEEAFSSLGPEDSFFLVNPVQEPCHIMKADSIKREVEMFRNLEEREISENWPGKHWEIST